MKKTDLPLVLLQSLNRLNVQLPKLAEETDGLVTKTFSDNNLICFEYADEDSGFQFELIKLELSNSTPIISFQISPSSNINNDKSVKRLQEKEVVANFQNWLGWLKVYEKSNLTEEDEFLKKYQEEFYTEFEIVDEDANTSPFSVEQQLFLDQYLAYVETKLIPQAKDNVEIAEIIIDVKLLREDLGRETKKNISKKFSSIFAKLRKSSIKLLGEFYGAAKKELFKRLITGGLDEISGLL